MSILAEVKLYSRFARGLRGFLAHRISPEEARAIVQRRLAERENNFLRLVERGVFGYPRSPYLPMLKLAGCEKGDIDHMVRTRGLEPTLQALREAGVYVTFEEYKGHKPIVRNGKIIPVQPHDFDNPFLSRYYQVESGGTTGAGTRISIDLDHYTALTPLYTLAHAAHGTLNMPMAIWHGILPDNAGIGIFLIYSRFRSVPQKWFSPVTVRGIRPSLKNRLATRYIVTMARLFGVPIPWPEPVGLDEAAIIARWAARTLKAHGACLISAVVSQALRVCVAAREEGLDLTGAILWGGGEPPTPAKVREMARVGARWIPGYFFTETGCVGQGCCRPADTNDIHFFKDMLALIQHPRAVPGAQDITVDAFLFTTLLPTAPKLMLNVESDDYGVMEDRSCGCPLESYGFTTHLRHIRSFRKLTGDGVTLVGSEMIRILEEVLPARFGGSPLDYQLLEEENERGFTRLSLLVSPRIQISDEAEVIDVVLEALARSSVAADYARVIWSQARALQVKRMEPVPTARGKLMPLHLARRSRGSANAPADSAPHEPEPGSTEAS